MLFSIDSYLISDDVKLFNIYNKHLTMTYPLYSSTVNQVFALPWTVVNNVGDVLAVYLIGPSCGHGHYFLLPWQCLAL